MLMIRLILIFLLEYRILRSCVAIIIVSVYIQFILYSLCQEFIEETALHVGELF